MKNRIHGVLVPKLGSLVIEVSGDLYIKTEGAYKRTIKKFTKAGYEVKKRSKKLTTITVTSGSGKKFKVMYIHCYGMWDEVPVLDDAESVYNKLLVLHGMVDDRECDIGKELPLFTPEQWQETTEYIQHFMSPLGAYAFAQAWRSFPRDRDGDFDALKAWCHQAVSGLNQKAAA